jgi:four helix bundle protein
MGEVSGGYRDLVVWQKSYKVAQAIYKSTDVFPSKEIYGLVSQMRRSAVSIPSNIAEGYRRNSSGDFARFLSISFGSLAELETQILLSTDFGYMHKAESDKIMSALNEISKMLLGLIKKVRE